MYRQITLLLCLFIYNELSAQTIQFLFCGKTEAVADLSKIGNAAIKLDFLKIGVRGGSQTAPFYVLGNAESVKTNDNFKDKVIANGCSGSNGTTQTCSMCTTCSFAESTTALNLGNPTGKMVGTVKVESKGNDLYIMNTDVNNVVCYETHKISLAGQANKKLDVYYKYEGIAKDNVSQVRNVSLNYRFNNDSYFTTPYFFNKNSSNVGVFEDVGSIIASVPLATEDLSKKLSFEIIPNPVKENIVLNTNVFQGFHGFINILNDQGANFYFEETNFDPNQTTKEIRTLSLKSGMYLLQISDEEGRISSKKFQKL